MRARERAFIGSICRLGILPFATTLGLLLADTALADLDEVQEWSKLIKAAETIGSPGTNLFGDSTNYYDGATTFSVTDIDLPGNNSLPVRVARTLAAEAIEDGDVDAPHLMADWDLDLPYISGIFSEQYGWKTSGPNPYARCSDTANYHPVNIAKQSGRYWQYWRGNYLHLPGRGKRALLHGYAGATATDGQTTTLGTADFTQIRCIAQIANPSSQPGFSGEGFIALTADGTRYFFDWMASRYASTLTSYSAPGSTQEQLPRVEIRIYPTRAIDRFGNQVTYTWSGSQLMSISSGDGRSITFTYNSYGFIATATANGRVWRYSYPNGLGLASVTLPDNSSWTMSGGGLHLFYDPKHPPVDCDQLSPWYGDLSRTFVFKHPSGATGEFTFAPMRHGRSQVSKKCQVESDVPGFVAYGPPILRDNFALIHKKLYGPGLAALDWTLSYSAAQGGYAGCSPCVPDTKWVQVTNPDGSYARYTFGIRYFIDEGKLLNTQTFAANGALMRSQAMSYAISPSSPPYPGNIGAVGALHSDDFADEYLVPRAQTTLSQDGDTYTNTVNSFDAFAREVSVTRANSFGGSRTDVAAYYDDTARWALGQIKSRTNSNTGIIASQTDFDPTVDKPSQIYAFGLPLLHFTYNADGTLASAVDGLNRSTTLSNWKRGAPQRIGFPDSTSQSAVIDDNGWVSSVTSGRGYVTSYGYDSVGRLASLTYPTADTVAWSSLGMSYVVLSAAELGMPAGTWRARSIEGRMQKSVYYDPLWRPVLSEDKDTTTSIVRYTATAYDFAGRVTFKSYPSVSSSPTAGYKFTYDALGRLTRKTTTDGATLQTLAYLSSNRQQLIDASGNPTTTAYQAFDVPDSSAPLSISAPQGQTTAISRNVFGEILSVTQSGAEGTVADSYLYDGYHRLCKRIEPETGQTVLAYDAASQLAWTAKGQAGSTASCDYGSVPGAAKIAFTYDGRGRETAVTYPDASGNLTLGYDPDGHLTSAVNPITNWSYTYDKRGLLETEQAVIDGKTLKLDPGYDVQGHLSSLLYPDGRSIAYAPDAWGRPTQVGSYASGIAYYPTAFPVRIPWAMASVIAPASTRVCACSRRKSSTAAAWCNPSVTATPTTTISSRSPTVWMAATRRASATTACTG